MTTTLLAPRVGVALSQARALLEASGLPTARHDAECLLAHLLGTVRFALYLAPERELTVREVEAYRRLLERRASHEPLQYLVGHEEFFGLRLSVGPGVFIPRPETELLVEVALRRLPSGPALAVDLGTGSAAIVLALARSRPGLEAHAVDASQEALDWARANAAALGLADRIYFYRGDLFAPLEGLQGRFDLVVSNPPYIAAEKMEELPAEVSRFEPSLALNGGPAGTILHQRIIDEAPRFLKPGGWLLMELGMGQSPGIMSLLERAGLFEDVTLTEDFLGIDRVVAARRG